MAGPAVGDATGFPTEFNDVPSILAKYGRVRSGHHVPGPHGRHTGPLRPGARAGLHTPARARPASRLRRHGTIVQR